MVFLAITNQGLKELLHLAKSNGFPIWCSADAVTDAEYEKLKGLNISRFEYSLCGDSENLIQDAIYTISEHHPNEHIWVETIGKF